MARTGNLLLDLSRAGGTFAHSDNNDWYLTLDSLDIAANYRCSHIDT
jgi:hypothetical protein